MRDHDPRLMRPSKRDYYSYNNTEQESTLKQMLGALCRASGTEPDSTYLHSYLHGNPAALSLTLLFSLPLQSVPPFAFAPHTHSHPALCLSNFTFPLRYPPTPSRRPHCLKSNSRAHINFDQSEGLIYLAERTEAQQRAQVELHRDEKGQAMPYLRIPPHRHGAAAQDFIFSLLDAVSEKAKYFPMQWSACSDNRLWVSGEET